jgi:PleD family two-component response regulator
MGADIKGVFMENAYNDYFDLTVLLKGDIFGIRKIAAEYKSSAQEYFCILSEAIKLAPNTKKALEDFIKQKADRETYRAVDKMAALLKKMKCKKLVVEFNILLDDYKKSKWRLAAVHAGEIIKHFDEFSSIVISARQEKKPDASPDTSLSLKEFIQCLDDEETNRRMIILAVDDSPVILTSLSSVLGTEYNVFTLPKPAELEKVLKKLTPDLFLLDYEMPEINGFELLPIIRSFDEHKDTPVIYLTAHGTMDAVTAACTLGACDFIVKPFDPDILHEKIAKWIVRKKTF